MVDSIENEFSFLVTNLIFFGDGSLIFLCAVPLINILFSVLINNFGLISGFLSYALSIENIFSFLFTILTLLGVLELFGVSFFGIPNIDIWLWLLGNILPLLVENLGLGSIPSIVNELILLGTILFGLGVDTVENLGLGSIPSIVNELILLGTILFGLGVDTFSFSFPSKVIVYTLLGTILPLLVENLGFGSIPSIVKRFTFFGIILPLLVENLGLGSIPSIVNELILLGTILFGLGVDTWYFFFSF